MWHIRYPGLDGAPDVTVATTRPETMLGDTGVAVHPSDARWREAVGRQVLLPLMERPIPIVADDYADPEMGSGAVKVTPAHDPNDYEVGARHDLVQIVVIGFDGMMTDHAGAWAGLDRYECRRQVIVALKAAGLLVQIDDHEHAVPHHDKCGTVIEPLPMEQWFMNMEGLAAKARAHLQGGGTEIPQVRYQPDRYRGYALEWLDNIRDWALSRQIWWGHRIPAWYCADCSGDGLTPLSGYDRDQALKDGAFRVAVEAGARPIVATRQPQACPDCDGTHLVQDPDVLDTWFSSALWPFATLGWPEPTPDLAYFHPTDLMITGRDILQQPEHPLDGYIDELVGCLLARGQVQDVGDAVYGLGDIGPIRDRPTHDLHAVAAFHDAVVTQGAYLGIPPGFISEEPAHEGPTHFAGGARDQDDSLSHQTPTPFICRAMLPWLRSLKASSSSRRLKNWSES